MSGDHTKPDNIADHKHQGLTRSEGMGQILGMTGEVERIGLDIGLVDGGRHHAVNAALPEVLNSSLQAGQSCLPTLRRRLSNLHPNLIIHTGNQVNLSFLKFIGRPNGEGAEVRDIERLAVVGNNLGGAVDYRGTDFQHIRIQECFDNQFTANAVHIPEGDPQTHFQLFFLHNRYR